MKTKSYAIVMMFTLAGFSNAAKAEWFGPKSNPAPEVWGKISDPSKLRTSNTED